MTDLLFKSPPPADADLTFGDRRSPADLVFQDPAGSSTDLVFGSSDNTAITINATIAATLAAPQASLDADTGITGSLSASLTGPTAAIDAEIDSNISDALAADTGAVWQRSTHAASDTAPAWIMAPYVETEARAAWEKANANGNETAPSWGQPDALPNLSGDAWEQGIDLNHSRSGAWENPARAKRNPHCKWEQGAQTANNSGDAFNYPPFLPAATQTVWEWCQWLGLSRRDSIRYAQQLGQWLTALYEYGIQPPPGHSVPPGPEPEPQPEPFRGDPNLLFDGTYRNEHLIFNGTFEQPPVPITSKAVYLFMPTITLYRLSDGAELDAINVSWTTDLDSWGWRFNATLKKNADLALVKPDSNGPQEIGCKINGHTFTAIVESYNVSRQFGNNSYQINGRSLSGWLSDPYAPKRSRVISTDHTAQQLAELELQNTGWTLNWNTADWLVPAGAFSYQDNDPVAVIKQIAESVGAIVQSHPSSKTLVVKPRFPTSPHLWASATPDAILPAALIKQTAGEYRTLPHYNRAITTGGDTGGVIVTLTRDGTAGNELAPVVTDPLITHADAGYERGRNEIAAGGSWESMNITTWLTQNGTPGPGLMLPGYLVEIEDVDETYRTQISSTAITAQSSEDALTVRQVLTAERAFH
ncbi:hypothetical protein QKW35_20605 [Pontibacterium granulatum]|uniref:hypothetical protein n=1 Tax=Pontibacterium granulatum TaxID=2036029 RepID=UPI00249B83E9|nr:hypothetical protein [Pontibacterium granulatum]MDI3326785.1 hypothetical protein [Pontibacterium granulatum]